MITFFEKRIFLFYEKQGRKNLPWRKQNITPYEVWVSEIMLQQTQVSRVIEFYNRFLKKYPNIFSLSKTSWNTFLEYWQGLGYYSRGRNMLEAARIIAKNHGGAFPRDKKALLALPGIGEYTANAILSFGFDENRLAYDTNLKRVLGRFYFGAKDARVDVVALEKKFTSSKKFLNGALMDFASIICLKVPKCGECGLKNQCKYLKTKGVLEKAASKNKVFFPSRKARVFLWLHENHRAYYSSHKNGFKPFCLSSSRNTRETIQSYFQKKYRLLLSVRPPHKKVFIQNKPTLFVNAQILKGRHKFSIYSKSQEKKFFNTLMHAKKNK